MRFGVRVALAVLAMGVAISLAFFALGFWIGVVWGGVLITGVAAGGITAGIAMATWLTICGLIALLTALTEWVDPW